MTNSVLRDGGQNAFDLAALTEPLDEPALRAFWEQKASPGFWRRRRVITIAAWAILSLLGGGLLTILLVFSAALSGHPGALDDTSGWLVVGMMLAVALLSAPSLGVFPRRDMDPDLVSVFRLERFAHENGLAYAPDPRPRESFDPGDLPGLIFTVPLSTRCVVSNLVSRSDGVPFRAGECRYELPVEEGLRSGAWDFLEISLGRKQPHVILDSLVNNSGNVSRLPISVSPDDRVSLEGDFDRHFRTYAPNGMQRDALEVLTPDLMALLLDRAGSVDIELVENRLYFYRQGASDAAAPERWEWIALVLSTIGARMHASSGRYPGLGRRGSPARIQRGSRRIRRALWTWISHILGLGVLAALVALSVRIALG